jgi:hypothetical protein
MVIPLAFWFRAIFLETGQICSKFIENISTNAYGRLTKTYDQTIVLELL